MDQSELSDDPFEQLLSTIDNEFDGDVRPGTFYEPAGDCVFFHGKAVPYYRVRIDPILTVFRELTPDGEGEIVGLQVKNVRRFKIVSIQPKLVESNPDSNTPDLVELIIHSRNSRLEADVEKLRSDWEANCSNTETNDAQLRSDWEVSRAYAEAIRAVTSIPQSETRVQGLELSCV